MNITFIVLTVFTLTHLWIAVQLVLTARKSNQRNLYWLAGLFALVVCYSFFTPTAESPLSNYWVFHLGLIAGNFCLAMFIHTTFYRDRKSPVYIFLGMVVLAFVVDIYALAVNDLNLAGIMTIVGFINWTWHLVVARSAYGTVAADPSVENWIKARYRLMIVYIPLMMLITMQVTVSYTASIINLVLPPILLPISLIIIIASIVLQFLVWVMPEPFRLWLNREQQTRHEEEQRPLSVLDVFGTAMTAETGLRSMACLYAIRATVAKRIGSENSDAVQKYLNKMSYAEWDAILQHTELRRILINSGADNASATKAVENARKALIEKQSLLTLSAR